MIKLQSSTATGGAVLLWHDDSINLPFLTRRKLLAHQTLSKMALASVLNSDCADFSFDNGQPFAFGCGPGLSGPGLEAPAGDSLSFSVRNPLCSAEDDDVERKIEFLHGTTTLAFKVSEWEHICSWSYTTLTNRGVVNVNIWNNSDFKHHAYF